VTSLRDKGLLKITARTHESGDPTSNVYLITDEEVVHEVHQGSARRSLGVVHDVHPKDSHLKDSHRRRASSPKSEECEEQDSRSTSPPPADQVSEADLRDWFTDYDQFPLTDVAQSLPALNALGYSRRVLRKAVLRWHDNDHGRMKNEKPLKWFFTQGRKFLDEVAAEEQRPKELRCPECGKVYIGASCTSCGWEKPDPKMHKYDPAHYDEEGNRIRKDDEAGPEQLSKWLESVAS